MERHARWCTNSNEQVYTERVAEYTQAGSSVAFAINIELR